MLTGNSDITEVFPGGQPRSNEAGGGARGKAENGQDHQQGESDLRKYGHSPLLHLQWPHH